MADDDETSFKEESAPPPKRARRAVTKRKPITVAPDSDDDDDDDYEPVEPLTKLEDESGNSDNDNDNDNEDDSFAAPSTSADDQPGPSGLGKDGVEAPFREPNWEDGGKGRRRYRPPKTCPICCKTMVCTSFKRHMNMHQNIRNYECDICHKKFYTKAELNTHGISHATEKPFTCEICHINLKTKVSLKIHMASKHPKKEDLKCKDCNLDFTDSASFRQHRMLTHHANICHVCGKQLMSSINLAVHVASHISKEELNRTGVECNICKNKYANEKVLKRHMDVHRRRAQAHVCDICGKVVSTTNSLKMHKFMHEGIKNHQCTFCGKAFVSRNVLVQHIRTHTGDKPFKCKLCESSFTQRTPLKRHIKSVHEKKN